MNKLTVIIAAFLMAVVAVSPAHALLRSDVRQFEGEMVSKKGSMIVVRNAEGHKQQFQLSADLMHIADEGDQVFLIEDTTNKQVTFLKVLAEGPGYSRSR